MSVLHFMAIHPPVVNIFQSGLKWCTNWPTLPFTQPCHASIALVRTAGNPNWPQPSFFIMEYKHFIATS